MSKMLEIVQLGNPILWMVADPITSPNNQATIELANSLIETMLESGALGLAAPQVDVSERMIVFRSLPSPRYPNAPEIGPTVMMNPKIIKASCEETAGWESCYSIPSIWGIVHRPDQISIEFMDMECTIRRETYSGLSSRVIQHELDHLEGLLYIDRVKTTHDLYTRDEMLKHIDLQ